MLLDIQNIDKSFGSGPVLKAVSLRIDAGEIVALLGPSGCGKTTLLRIIAGLELPDKGIITYRGQDLAATAVHERGFGMVFQDYALFPHKDVTGNVEFGLRMLGWDREQRARRVSQVLDLIGLSGFERRSIHELSGGEQQRIALARSLAPSPRLLLLDEPMGSLDRALRERLMRELRSILKEAGDTLDRPEGITAIFVTHDQEEAFAVADRVTVMNAGKIEQEGSPRFLYRHPANAFVARFLGMDNLFEGVAVSTIPPAVLTPFGELKTRSFEVETGSQVMILIRPDASIPLGDEESGLNEMHGLIQETSFRGRYQVVTVRIDTQGGETVHLKLEYDTDVSLPAPGSTVTLFLDPEQIAVLQR